MSENTQELDRFLDQVLALSRPKAEREIQLLLNEQQQAEATGTLLRGISHQSLCQRILNTMSHLTVMLPIFFISAQLHVLIKSLIPRSRQEDSCWWIFEGVGKFGRFEH